MYRATPFVLYIDVTLIAEHSMCKRVCYIYVETDLHLTLFVFNFIRTPPSPPLVHVSFQQAGLRHRCYHRDGIV